MATIENCSLSRRQAGYNWLKSNLAFLLMLSALILFTSKSLYNIPIGIMSLIGLFRFIKSPALIWSTPVARAFTILFLCLWLPLLISFIDAVNYQRSAQTVFPYLRFLFAGLFVIQEIDKPHTLNKLKLVIFCIIAFWCIDAVIEFLFKTDLFGNPYRPGTISGIFYPEITAGHVTAALSPLYFESIRAHSKQHKWLWLLLIPLFMVVLLSARRAAWIMLAVSCSGFVLYLLKRSHYDKTLVKKLCVLAVVIIASMSLVVAAHKPLQARIQVTMGLFSGDYQIINEATATRLPVWRTAINIFQDNWINGIGPRGFRFVYQDYSHADNPFFKNGQTHPHQLLLEVLAETGMIGLLGLLLFTLVFIRFLLQQDLVMALWPWWLAVLTAVFPVNTHMAFYGSYWSSIFWWLLILTFTAASICIKNNCRQTAS